MPAMVAAIQGPDGRLRGVGITFLRPDGMGKAEIEQPRITRGELTGGAVRLAPAGPKLGIAEGLEDAATVQQETGLPCWAALGTSNLPRLELPGDGARGGDHRRSGRGGRGSSICGDPRLRRQGSRGTHRVAAGRGKGLQRGTPGRWREGYGMTAPDINETVTQPETFEAAVVPASRAPPHEYDKVRKVEADRLAVRVATLDEAVEKARPAPPRGRERGQGQRPGTAGL